MNMILKIAMRRPVIAVTRPESLRCPWGAVNGLLPF